MSKLDLINKVRQSTFKGSKQTTDNDAVNIPDNNEPDIESVDNVIENANKINSNDTNLPLEKPTNSSLLQDIRASEKKEPKIPVNVKLDKSLKMRLAAASNQIGCNQTTLIILGLEKVLDEIGY